MTVSEASGVSTLCSQTTVQNHLSYFCTELTRVQVLFISLVSVLGVTCDEVSAANALLQPTYLVVNCGLKPPFWWQSKYNLFR